MRLQDIMTSPVETMQMSDSAEDAFQHMRTHRIHHIVIMDGRSVVGVLSDRDLGSARGTSVRAGKTAGDLVGRTAVTGDVHMTVRQAANKLRGHGIGCLPIMDHDRLVGIVTTADLLDLIGRGVSRPIATTERPTLSRRGSKRSRAGRLV